MKALYIASVGSYAGKSLAALAIGLHLKERGLRVGYFKPVGTLPVEVNGASTDEDALFIARALGQNEETSALCPVLYTEELAQRVLEGGSLALEDKITQAFARVSAGRDLVLVGGIGNLCRGSLLHLSAPQVARLLNAQVLVVVRHESDSTVEELLLANSLLQGMVLGAIFNFVSEQQQARLQQVVIPYLESLGIPVLGMLRRDPLLGSVTVSELAEQLGARVLCCENKLGLLVEHFVIGAMNVQSAIRYFGEISNKAVITGGDRPDIQLAALQTATRAVILTGNLYPSDVIIRRAQQVGVPLLLVAGDTLSTVEEIDRIRGRLRVRQQAKVERARSLWEENIDFERLVNLLQMKARGGAHNAV